jgi:hypothetical protein
MGNTFSPSPSALETDYEISRVTMGKGLSSYQGISLSKSTVGDHAEAQQIQGHKCLRYKNPLVKGKHI